MYRTIQQQFGFYAASQTEFKGFDDLQTQRDAFYAGANAVFNLLSDIGDASLSEEAGDAISDGLIEEIQTYFEKGQKQLADEPKFDGTIPGSLLYIHWILNTWATGCSDTRHHNPTDCETCTNNALLKIKQVTDQHIKKTD